MLTVSTKTNNQLILGCIKGLKFEDIQPFIKSASKCNLVNNIRLFEDVDVSVKKKLDAYGVKNLPLKDYLDKSIHVVGGRFNRYDLDKNSYHIVRVRYLAYYNYLLRLVRQPETVVLCDVNDLVFQRNVFNADLERSKIIVFKEYQNKKIGSCEIHKQWMRNALFSEDTSALVDKEIINSGVIIGPYKLILDYLKRMITMIHLGETISFDDQIFHNYIIYSMNQNLVQIDDKESPIAVITRPSERLKIDNGILTNVNGKVVAIIHQYDRHFQLVRVYHNIKS